MGKENEEKELVLPSRITRLARPNRYAPFTSPSVPQQIVCQHDGYYNQPTRRRMASTGQESDLYSLRRSKRLKVSSLKNVSLDSSHHIHPVAVPKVTPSPRIMQVAAPQQVVVSPITKVISSQRRKALVQAAKSHGDHNTKKNIIVTRNAKGKLPFSSNAMPNLSFPTQRVPSGVPNIFSTSPSTTVFDSYKDGHCCNVEAERGYWFTYGFDYYQFLSLSEAKKSREDQRTQAEVDYAHLTHSYVCTRSMSKRIHKADEELSFGIPTGFYQQQSFLPTTDAHCYVDTSDERKGMLWDCSFPQHHELTPFMRTVLIHWLLEVGQCYSLVPETIHLTVMLIDRVLAIGLSSFICPYNASSAQKQEKGEAGEAFQQFGWEISKAKLQCVGRSVMQFSQFILPFHCYPLLISLTKVIFYLCFFLFLSSACMFIASKIEEVNPPSASDLALISGSTYAAKDILSMELQICLSLKFDLHFVTPIPFLEKYLVAGCHKEEHKDEKMHLKGFALYLLELSLLEYSFTKYPSSMIAASALYLAKVFYFNATTCRSALSAVQDDYCALARNTKQYWDDTLAFYTGYTALDLKEAIRRLLLVHNKVQDTPIHHAVFLRYQQQGWIANILSKSSLHDLEHFPEMVL
jgi:hypothetical protein